MIQRTGWTAAWTGVCLLLAIGAATAHNGPMVIVDTDMAADDARALAVLLNSPCLNVLGVVTSDGVSAPGVGATNCCRMLRFLKREDVAVGVGRTLNAAAPAFRKNATELDWGELGEPLIPRSGLHEAKHLIRLVLRETPDRVIYVCLGPLTNLGDALEDAPDLAERISQVMWYGSVPNEPQADWNARRDEAALRKIVKAGLRVEVIRWADDKAAPAFDDALLDQLVALESPAAELIVTLLGTGRGAELVAAGHLRLWDDLVALHLVNPSIGRLEPLAGMTNWWQLTSVDAIAVKQAIPPALRLVPPRATVIISEFPSEPTRLLPDVREMASQIIARHGLEEWKATVLTSELHRHLGTYSIIGAKMGLRAREWFNVALDELRVESHAGLKPPLSCLNDGLQVATGASLGRGTIKVINEPPLRCEAVFSYGDRRFRMRLKPEYAKRIAGDMAALEKKHGGTTPAYFQEVRTVSLKHWLDFDRNSIFEETEEGVPAKEAK